MRTLGTESFLLLIKFPLLDFWLVNYFNWSTYSYILWTFQNYPVTFITILDAFILIFMLWNLVSTMRTVTDKIEMLIIALELLHDNLKMTPKAWHMYQF